MAMPMAKKAGRRVGECCDDYTYKWAVFDRAEVQAFLKEEGETFNSVDNSELAGWLTGWYSQYHGAGQGFSHHPCAHVSRTKVLVKQAIGYDI